MMLSLIADFGVRNTVANIQLNPEMFADQFAGPLVYNAWLASVSLLTLIVIVVIKATVTKSGKLGRDDAMK